MPPRFCIYPNNMPKKNKNAATSTSPWQNSTQRNWKRTQMNAKKVPYPAFRFFPAKSAPGSFFSFRVPPEFADTTSIKSFLLYVHILYSPRFVWLFFWKDAKHPQLLEMKVTTKAFFVISQIQYQPDWQPTTQDTFRYRAGIRNRPVYSKRSPKPPTTPR